MREQSHKDEMSAAIRGDFERLRGRGVASTIAPPEAEAEPDPAPAPEAEVAQPGAGDEPAARSWRARFFG
jgi:hypothetical protein